MTLKELLDSLSFDEIAPFLIRHYTYDYAPGDFSVDLLPKIFCHSELNPKSWTQPTRI